jgi:SAM-dependent methyltransferase
MEAFLYGNMNDDERLVRVQGKLGHWATRAYYEYRDSLFAGIVESYAPFTSKIVELGCGAGRNLFVLKRAMPDRKYVGLDISENAISACSLAYKCLGVDRMEFNTWDALSNDQSIIEKYSEAAFFTHMTLEQLKCDIDNIIYRLLKCRPKVVIHFEPLPSLVRGSWLARATVTEYVAKKDYADNILAAIKRVEREGQLEVLEARSLGLVPKPDYDIGFLAWRPTG